MQLKCTWVPETSGFLGIGAAEGHNAEGLTLGKTYTGQAVPLVVSGADGTRIRESDYKILLINDQGKWEFYELDMFGACDSHSDNRQSRSFPPPPPLP